MKLLAKNNLLFFQLTSLLIIIGSILFYLSINYIIRDELDKKLKNNHARVIEQVASGKPFPQFPPKFEVQKLDHLLPQSESLADTLVFDPIEKEEEFFRQLSTITTINDESYLVTVRTSLVEAEDLLFAIGIIASILFVLLLAGLYWLNRRQVARLWSPFQQNLPSLKPFP